MSNSSNGIASSLRQSSFLAMTLKILYNQIMKIKWLILLGIILGVVVAFQFHGSKKKTITSKKIEKPTPTPEPSAIPLRMKSIFVPYWSDIDETSDFSNYDRIIYFGLNVGKDGVNTNDPGYLKMEHFESAVKDKPQKKWLALRMTDTNTNLDIMNAVGSWDQIASDAATIASEHSFDGVVLDLEMGALSSEGLKKRMVDFVSKIHDRLQSEKKQLALTIYGDTFYRKRPYDLEALSKNSEEIMVMAYDFHKSYGESGPNFPLGGRETYGYDFGLLVRDFLLFVPQNKLTVIFGMYGYDWIVDEKKRPIKPATSVTLHEVKKKFLDDCESKNCIVRRDEKAYESEVNYIDPDYNYHIVWFEDQVSVDKKSHLMRQKGIDSIAYWAYGYF